MQKSEILHRQDSDDGDNNEQFDQSEAVPLLSMCMDRKCIFISHKNLQIIIIAKIPLRII